MSRQKEGRRQRVGFSRRAILIRASALRFARGHSFTEFTATLRDDESHLRNEPQQRRPRSSTVGMGFEAPAEF